MNPKSKSGTLALVLGLGTTCTIGYGTILYSFSILSLEIGRAFAWPNEFIFGVYSLGILLSGLIAAKVGRLLDKSGARWPMCAGSFVVACCLLGLAFMSTQLEFFVFMLLLEGVSILVLYESAFVALTQSVGHRARQSISQITLIAGFASTIFWPLVSELLRHISWREVYVLMALLHVFVCLPIHWWTLRDNTRKVQQCKPDVEPTRAKQLQHSMRVERLVGFAFGLIAFCIIGIQVHLFGVFSQLQVEEKLAILAGTLIGPFQVLSRATDMLLSRYINAAQLAYISLVAMSLGVMFALFGVFVSPYAALLFAAFFGIGQGLTNIVRGALPLLYFGELNYGQITGRMNRIRLFLTAISPVCFAFVLESMGAIYVLVTMCLLCFAGMALLKLAALQHQKRSLTAGSYTPAQPQCPNNSQPRTQ